MVIQSDDIWKSLHPLQLTVLKGSFTAVQHIYGINSCSGNSKMGWSHHCNTIDKSVQPSFEQVIFRGKKTQAFEQSDLLANVKSIFFLFLCC